MLKETAIGAGIITAIATAATIPQENALGCDGDTIWEASAASTHLQRVNVWPQRAIISRDKHSREARVRYEPKPYFDANVWDDYDLALCPLIDEEENPQGYIVQGRNGPPIVVPELQAPAYIFAIDENHAHYFVFDENWYQANQLNLETGEVFYGEKNFITPYR